MRRRPWSRQSLAAEIWPEIDYRSSGRLRQVLWLLRKSLSAAGADPRAVLAIDDQVIALRPSLSVDLDVARFEEFVRHRPPDLEAALDVYEGDLAEGLDLECLSTRREYLADLYENALATVARARMAAGDADAARSAALELLERDPLREEAHAVLIETYGLLGSRSQVLRQYRRLCRLLATELGVKPLAETRAAYRAALERLETESEERAALQAVAGAP